MRRFFTGLESYIAAHRAIFRYRLWPVMFIPGLLSIVYVGMIFYLASLFSGDATMYLCSNYLPGFMQGEITYALTAVLIWLLFLLTAYFTCQPIVLILFSPILSYLSELVDVRIFGGESIPLSAKQILKDILRAILVNARNIIKMLFFIVLAWGLVLIPIIGALLSSTVILLIQSYYAGYGLVDFTLERKRFGVRESARFGKRNRWLVTGIGAGFILLMFIPVAGWFAAPAYGAVAATIAALDILRSEQTSG